MFNNPTTLLEVLNIGQLLTLMLILWRGARWTSRMETELHGLSIRLDDHISQQFKELRDRVHDIEKSCRGCSHYIKGD